jgi:ribonucleoside-triphosphate reductase (thioredoxin)
MVVYTRGKEMSKEWSNLAKIVYRRTYSRNDNGNQEKWEDTIERVIEGNSSVIKVSEAEKNKLRYFMKNRKATPAGRGLWFSGSPNHKKIGGAAAVNCWAFSADDWENLIIAQDLSMLGGGVGLSVEHKYVSKLPKVKKGVVVINKNTKDADYIVPDSREGWNELTRRILESFLVTGKSFSFSTICVRGYGELIKGFGGTSSGPKPLIDFAEKVCAILQSREGRALRPIDVVDIFTSIGEMVVSGNVRRSAIIIIGDCWDKEYLKAKRWDLGPIPSQRAMANFSVACDDVEDLHPLFWKTYEMGEPFGIINRTNIQKFGRIGELNKDTAYLVNPCAEAVLENAEPCNLQELALPNLKDEQEFVEAARLMHRYGKRVTCDPYHQFLCQEVITRNRRIGTGITGCLASPLFNPKTLNNVYKEIQKENESYSKELGINKSIRTTVVKPSGTLSKVLDMDGYEGLHAAYSDYFIQRVRFAANDPLIPLLVEAGHKIEPVIRLDGTLDHKTLVVDFYVKTPSGSPVADRDWDTWKQLDVVKMVNENWSDQSSSVTVYYKKEEIPKLKQWLSENLKYLKTISFLCHSDHGFKQAPKEAISKEDFEKLSKNIKDLDLSKVDPENENLSIDNLECESGACPIK